MLIRLVESRAIRDLPVALARELIERGTAVAVDDIAPEWRGQSPESAALPTGGEHAMRPSPRRS